VHCSLAEHGSFTHAQVITDILQGRVKNDNGLLYKFVTRAEYRAINSKASITSLSYNSKIIEVRLQLLVCELVLHDTVTS